MSFKQLIVMIMVIAALAVLGIGATAILGSLNGTQTLSHMSEISAYIDMQPGVNNINFSIDHPTHSTKVAVPYMRPFNATSTFAVLDPADELEIFYNFTFAADNALTIAPDGVNVTGDITVTGPNKEVVGPAATAVFDLRSFSNTIGVEAIFLDQTEGHLEEFFSGFLPFRESAFYRAYKDSPADIATNTSTVFRTLAEALFETYTIDGAMAVSATPLATNYAANGGETVVTLIGATRPDVNAILTQGRISNPLTREDKFRLRYVSHVERNRAYVEAILDEKVFTNAAADQALIDDLVDMVMQVPEGLFIASSDKYAESPVDQIPVVRQIN